MFSPARLSIIHSDAALRSRFVRLQTIRIQSKDKLAKLKDAVCSCQFQFQSPQGERGQWSDGQSELPRPVCL